jgi:hypothetical protein
MVGTVFGSSQNMLASNADFATPSVCVWPCSEGYWPVKIVLRDGVHAVAPV